MNRRGLKLLIYSEPGAGKTVLIGSGAESMGPLLLLDCEAGFESIESKCREITVKELGKPEKGKIDLVHVTKWTDIQEVYNWLVDHPGVYNTVALDTLTEANRLCVQYVTAQSNSQHVVIAGKKVTSLQDYGVIIEMINDMVRAFRDVRDLNVILTAHVESEKDQASSVLKYWPSLTGKLSQGVPALVDVFGFLRTKANGTREIVFQPQGMISAKDRTEGGKLGAIMEEPTMTKIMDKRNG